MIYIAYGSNMNKKWMADLCPSAQFIGVSQLKGYCLCFRGDENNAYATILEDTTSSVPVTLWEIKAVDEVALDEYEDYPTLYYKEMHSVNVGGEIITGMLYKMVAKPKNSPTKAYYTMLVAAYQMNGFDLTILQKALEK